MRWLTVSLSCLPFCISKHHIISDSKSSLIKFLFLVNIHRTTCRSYLHNFLYIVSAAGCLPVYIHLHLLHVQPPHFFKSLSPSNPPYVSYKKNGWILRSVSELLLSTLCICVTRRLNNLFMIFRISRTVETWQHFSLHSEAHACRRSSCWLLS